MTLDRSKVPTGSAQGFSSYFGSWELVPNEGCVIHHLEGNLNANQVGQAAKRYSSFDDAGRLSLATPPAEAATARPQASCLFGSASDFSGVSIFSEV